MYDDDEKQQIQDFYQTNRDCDETVITTETCYTHNKPHDRSFKIEKYSYAIPEDEFSLENEFSLEISLKDMHYFSDYILSIKGDTTTVKLTFDAQYLDTIRQIIFEKLRQFDKPYKLFIKKSTIHNRKDFNIMEPSIYYPKNVGQLIEILKNVPQSFILTTNQPVNYYYDTEYLPLDALTIDFYHKRLEFD